MKRNMMHRQTYPLINPLTCFFVGLAFWFLLFFYAAKSDAAVIYVDQNSGVTQSVGDFQAIGAFTGDASNQGSTYELISSSSNAWSFSVPLASLWSYLSSAGVTSTPGLVFGYSANQKNNSPVVSITALSFSFQREDGSVDEYALADNQLQLFDFNSGSSLAEAEIQIDLGFDFMQEYAADSVADLTITASMSNNNNGPDRLFLSSAFTGSPLTTYQTSLTTVSEVPLPASFLLFCSGILPCLCLRKIIGT